MRRRLHMTILSVLVLAIGGGAAASAQAEPYFEAAVYPATIDSAPMASSIFSFGPAKWTCHGQSFSGKATEKSTALTLAPAYTECMWAYPVTTPQQPYSVVKMAMNGCDYRLHSGKRLVSEYEHLLSLECPAGQQLVIELNVGTMTICRLTVAAQTNKSRVRSTNKEIGLEMSWLVEKLKYTQDLSNPLMACPVKPGTYEDMTYSGKTRLTATAEPGKQVPLSVTGE